MWEAISLVTSGLTLVAFLAAVIAFVVMQRSKSTERKLELTSEATHAKLIEHTLEFFKIDTSTLDQDDKARLAMAQVHARSKRFQMTGVVVIVVAVLFAGVTTFAIQRQAVAGNTGGDQPATRALVENWSLIGITTQKPQEPYFVILGGYENQRNAKRQVAELQEKSVPAVMVDGNDYPQLTDGIYNVVVPSPTKPHAEELLNGFAGLIHDAYIKRVGPS